MADGQPQGWVSWMAIAGQAITEQEGQVAAVVELVIVRHLVGGSVVEGVAVGSVLVGGVAVGH